MRGIEKEHVVETQKRSDLREQMHDSIPDAKMVELIKRLIEWLEHEKDLLDDDPDREWDQREWGRVYECKTKCCVAGKIALLTGMHPTSNEKEGMLTLSVVSRRPGETRWAALDHVYVDRYVSDLFGLTEREAMDLFSGGNSSEYLISSLKGLILKYQV